MTFCKEVVFGITLIFVLTIITTVQAQNGNAAYGHPCKDQGDPGATEDDLCNVLDNLVCLYSDDDETENRCGCPPSTHWEPNFNKCLIKAGQSCSKSEVGGTCTENAYCDQPDTNAPGTCTCISDPVMDPPFNFKKFIPTKLGFCKASFFSECTDSADCSVEARLSCQPIGTDEDPRKRCNCMHSYNLDVTAWNERESRCEVFMDTNYPNSMCTDSSDCVENAICESNRCKCKAPEYIPYDTTFGTRCALDYNLTCHFASGECGNYLCRQDSESGENKCLCPLFSGEELYHYDPETKSCVFDIFNGRACNPSKQECVRHASCNTVTEACECDEGYSADFYNQCYANYGTRCSNTTECMEDDELVCLEGVCGCAPNSFFDIYARRCVKGIGQPCVNTYECIGSGQALCDSNSKECACRQNSVPMADAQICLWDYKASCGHRDFGIGVFGYVCNFNKLLSCNAVQEKCICEREYFEVDDDSEFPCRAKVDHACHVNFTEVTSRPLKCVPNAQCIESQIGAGTYGTCICEEGYKGISDGSCYNPLGGNTTPDGGTSGGTGRNMGAGGHFKLLLTLLTIMPLGLST